MRKRYFIDDGGQMYGPYTRERAIRLANHMIGWRCVVELEAPDVLVVTRTWGEERVA